MAPRVLSIETPELFETAVMEVVELLKRGEVVVLPTETVYGLAANAFASEAVSSIFELKGRPSENPVIVHIASLHMAHVCVSKWPTFATELAREFWPGPLTLVLPKSDRIPPHVTGGGPTVGIRWPAHPFMQEVIKRCEFPLAAPSANPANEISPTKVAHIAEKIKVPLIIDAGPSAVGIESTVLDISAERPRILRPGMITAEEIRKILPELEETSGAIEKGPRKSPGQFPRHYAPRAGVKVCRWQNDAELHRLAVETGEKNSQIHIITYDKIPQDKHFGRVAVVPNDPEAYARALYAELHQSDALGASMIIVEEPPNTAGWEGIRDRLRRASSDS